MSWNGMKLTELKSKMTKHEYDFLVGEWHGVKGAAFNQTAEFCSELGFGTYGQPTEYGQKVMREFEKQIP